MNLIEIKYTEKLLIEKSSNFTNYDWLCISAYLFSPLIAEDWAREQWAHTPKTCLSKLEVGIGLFCL